VFFGRATPITNGFPPLTFVPIATSWLVTTREVSIGKARKKEKEKFFMMDFVVVRFVGF